MARRTNYGFEKRQRELEKKKKKEAKREAKRLAKEEAAGGVEGAEVDPDSVTEDDAAADPPSDAEEE